MSLVLLAADVGNSVASLALFRGRRRVAAHAIAIDRLATTSAAALRRALGKQLKQSHAVLIGSVNPPAARALERLLRRTLPDTRPLLIGRDLRVPVANRANKPAQVGADRLLNTLAAFEITGRQTVVVDYGTCIVFDIISRKGEFVGGIITPGHKLIASTLASGTALLPQVITTRKPKLVGGNTAAAIRAGTFYGITGTVNGILEELRRQRGPSRVLATGGHAKLFAPHGPAIEAIEPYLTLDGIRLTHESTRRKCGG